MLKWLENAVFYEIYPISFYDYNNDGKGDLKGIINKVGYLKELGVNAVWFNPIFKSPFKDGGYDIVDYYEIDEKFGSMQDLEELIKVFHENGIKVILDLVIGHTSNKHKWFKKSALKTKNKYSDYYIWTDDSMNSNEAIYGLYNRNGGYIKNYYASQPALNFGYNQLDLNSPWKMHYKDERLKPLRNEFLNLMRFYLEKGIDGFRVDMASSVIKEGKNFDGENPFDDSDEGLEGVKWFWNEILGTLRKEYKDKVYIAEWVVPQNSIGKCGFDIDFLTHDTLAFNELYRNENNTNLDKYYEKGYNYFSREGKGSLDNFVKYVEFLYSKIDNKGMFTAPTGTHDEIRMGTYKDNDLIKCIFAFLLTIKQIPFIYYGDELGIEHNFTVSKDGGLKRTGARTPMLWNEEKGRGFSQKSTTYLPVSTKKGISVESLTEKENSILNIVKDLIKIRKTHNSLKVSAKQEFIEKSYPAIYKRTGENEEIVVMINPSNGVYKRKEEYKKVLYFNNCEILSNEIILNACSFVILEK